MRSSDLAEKGRSCYHKRSGGGRVVDAVLVGRVLQTYRTRKGMSQEVLRGLDGLDRTHYSKLERGLRSPTLDTLFKLAQALDVPPHEIIQAIEVQMRI